MKFDDYLNFAKKQRTKYNFLIEQFPDKKIQLQQELQKLLDDKLNQYEQMELNTFKNINYISKSPKLLLDNTHNAKKKS